MIKLNHDVIKSKEMIRKSVKTRMENYWKLPEEIRKQRQKKMIEGLKKKVIQYDLFGNYLQTYNSLAEAEKINNIFATNISQCCKKNIKQAGGYIWRYESEVVQNGI